MTALSLRYQFIDLLKSNSDPFDGTGFISEDYRPFADPPSVADVSAPLAFKKPECRIVVLSLTITSQAAAPNWFGIAFRQNIKTFTSVNIFFHPSPYKLADRDYLKRSTEWRTIFRYPQNLGIQFDAGDCDQILLVPIFNNASYGSGGIFTLNWNELLLVTINAVKAVALWQGPPQGPKVDVTTIAQNALTEWQKGNLTPIEFKDVVLSCFSYGRTPMLNFRSRAKPSVESFLRGIWDFDGTGPALPTSSGKVQVIAYDQLVSNDPSHFHAPVWRWSSFPAGAPKNWELVHGLMPECLLWHATTMSDIGK
jgi:hypothetical protein